MPNLSDLQLFLEAARLGSLSAAARQLERTPATASASLKRLEEELNVRLVERNTRSLRLTPEGLLFRERVAPALALLEDARHSVHFDCADIGGEIRLTAPVDFARQWLRPLMDEFQRQHPQVRFSLLAGDTVRDLVSEPLDLALRYGELPDSALVARRLLDNRRLVVGTPEYFAKHGRPGHPHDLLAHNCVIYMSRGRAFRRWSFQRGRETLVVEVNGDRLCNDGALVRDWVLDGAGLAYKSELDVRKDIRTGRLEPAFRGWAGSPAPLNAVYPGGGPRPVRVRRFVEFLRERLDRVQAGGKTG
ncbi:LysR family transcriptional regulator [Microbulbifer halophilus]|uniref:LysR family transcriptional regulator n=1 Tax=Microbulbifer halophilus TaxID=453963 RepID=A0ABW5EAB5_9GAMM|nr:LysR family transcriptional regulator [Microbulbifer halophilus]MCW8125836.1 LysR family transcriptional regulator [Microbulbifer halophilus]